MKLLHQKSPNISINERDTLDYPLHLHDVMEIAYLRQGHALAQCSNNRYLLEEGDLFITFPNQPHSYEQSQGVVCDVIIIPCKPFLSPWRNLLTQSEPETPVLKKGSWEESGIRTLLDLARPERKSASEAILQGYALLIVGKLIPLLSLVPIPTGSGDAVRNLLLFISEHYQEPLTRKQIARAVGYHESYVSHLFSEELGMNLKEYVNSLRLRDAKQLLTESDLSVSRISLSLGFGSIRSFNRSFLRAFGISPTRYREGENRKKPRNFNKNSAKSS